MSNVTFTIVIVIGNLGKRDLKTYGLESGGSLQVLLLFFIETVPRNPQVW